MKFSVMNLALAKRLMREDKTLIEKFYTLLYDKENNFCFGTLVPEFFIDGDKGNFIVLGYFFARWA